MRLDFTVSSARPSRNLSSKKCAWQSFVPQSTQILSWKSLWPAQLSSTWKIMGSRKILTRSLSRVFFFRAVPFILTPPISDVTAPFPAASGGTSAGTSVTCLATAARPRPIVPSFERCDKCLGRCGTSTEISAHCERGAWRKQPYWRADRAEWRQRRLRRPVTFAHRA